MVDIVEHVARAICRQDHPCWSIVDEMFADERLDGTGRTPRIVYSDLARAAIEAMREPSKEMKEALLQAHKDGTNDVPAATAWDSLFGWKIMIDTALQQEAI